ncbi:MAG: DUF3880 domain-containing protein [Lachnospiraceae bacterium]|nr:DUF3880 domain-containing protein [Lachnospiraceae bacterium]
MKILYLEWNSYANTYVKEALMECGHELISFDFPASDNPKSNESVAQQIVLSIISNQADICFSLNYYPVAAIACKACNIKYVSWTYDSPYVLLYSDTVFLDTNYVFIFDKEEYYNLKNLGVSNIFYLPMAFSFAKRNELADPLNVDYKHDIAMIGSMYSEAKHNLYGKLNALSSYERGYLEALIETQKFTYGVDIITPSLTDAIIHSMEANAPMRFPEDELQTPRWTYSNYFLKREVTKRERKEALDKLSEGRNVSLFTHEATPFLTKVNNFGPVDYYTQMPGIMNTSKINLNITLRSIGSGMPLRAMDIMGCGGFLLTNFQADFLDFFTPGEDYVYFEGLEDLADKVDFYLANDSLRRDIAHNAFEKINESHTYIHRISQMMDIVLDKN